MHDFCQQLYDAPTGPIEFCDIGSGLPVLYFHGTGAGLQFLLQHHAIHEPACLIEVLLGDVMLEPQHVRHDRRGDELAVRVLQRSTGLFAVILKDHDRLEAGVAYQVIETKLQRTEQQVDLFDGLLGQIPLVIGGFDDHLVGPAAPM